MATYLLLTICHDYRGNFSTEMFAERGIEGDPAIFVQTETPVAFLVWLLFLVRDNRVALAINHLYAVAGSIILAGSTAFFDAGRTDVGWWMVANGFGLFLGYVPFNCILFDRLVAVVGVVATSVFLIYVADSLGYVGVVALLLYKNFGDPSGSILGFCRALSYGSAAVIVAAMAASWLYFRRGAAGRVSPPVAP